MLKNIKESSSFQIFRQNIIALQIKILKNSYKISYMKFLLYTILFTFSKMLALIETNVLHNQQAQQFFKYFWASEWASLFVINPWIIDITIISIVMLIMILFLILFFNKEFNTGAKMVGLYLNILMILSTPFTGLLVENCRDLFNSNELFTVEHFLKGLSCIFILFGFAITAFFIFFNSKPIRQNNIAWKFSNYPQFLRYLNLIARAIIFQWEDISQAPVIILISLFIEIQINKLESSSGYLNQKIKAISNFSINFIICLHVCVFIVIITGRNSLTPKLFIVSLLGCITASIVQFYTAYKTYEQLPQCKPQNKIKIYNFYFQFMTLNKNQNENPLLKIITTHQLFCSSQECMFAPSVNNAMDMNYEQQTIVLSDLNRSITAFLQKYRYQSAQSQIIYQVWKYQQNMKVSINTASRQFNIWESIIVNYISGVRDESPQKNSVIMMNEEQSNGLKSDFYKQAFIVIDNNSLLNEELFKSRSLLVAITSTLLQIDYDTKKLANLFDQIVQEKLIDYGILELYSKIIEMFYQRSKFRSNLNKKLENITAGYSGVKNPRIDEPTFHVEMESGIIQSSNTQALRLMRARKYQLKDKKFETILYQKINLDQLYSHCKPQKNNNKKILIFMKKFVSSFQQSKQNPLINESTIQARAPIYDCAYLNITTNSVNNKAFYKIKISKKDNFNSSIELLINSNTKQLILSDKSQIGFSNTSESGQNYKSIKQLYDNYLIKEIENMQDKKSRRVIFKLENSQQIICHFNQLECVYENHRVISVRISQKNQSKRSNYFRKYQLHKKFKNFSFCFNQDPESEDSLVLEGKKISLKKSQILNKQLFTNYNKLSLSGQISNALITVCEQKRTDICRDIKTYRLFDGDLYNIDLEDKEAYLTQVQNLNSKDLQNNHNQCIKKIPGEVIFIIMFLIAVFLLALGIVVKNNFSQSILTMSTLNIQFANISLFSINYYRINSVLRDVINSFYQDRGKNFEPDVLESYEQLHQFSSIKLFSDQTYTVIYNQRQFVGNLNQLLQLALAYIYEYLNTKDTDIVQSLHDYLIYYMGDAIYSEKQQRYRKCMVQIDKLLEQSKILLILKIVATFFLGIAFIVACIVYKIKIIKAVEPFLYLSQNQTRRLIELCDKFKQYILIASKNSQPTAISDNSNLNSSQKYRKRPKKIKIGINQLLLQIFICIVAFSLIFIVAFLHYNQLSSDISKFQLMISQEKALSQSYIGICSVSNEIQHVGRVNMTKIRSIEQQSFILQQNKGTYKFSDDLSNKIQLLLFNNSCSYLKQQNMIPQSQNCSNMQQGFKINNPFEIGLAYYIRNQHHNLLQDLQQTFAITGVYSTPFKRIFLKLSKQAFDQTTAFIKKIQVDLQILNYLLIIIIVVQIISICAILLHFQIKLKTIQSTIIHLNYMNQKPEQKPKNIKKTRQEISLSRHNLISEKFTKDQQI